MADNITFTNTGTGAVPNSTVIRSRQTSGGQQIQAVDVAPFAATTVSGGQYALSVGTSTPVTLTVPSGATHAWLSVDSGGSSTGVRFTFDGTAPTSTVGHFLAVGDALTFVDNISSLKLLGQNAAATVQVSYFKFV